jgi:hypothetical protein
VEDDLVFSGAGSGCNTDDEDECTPVFESGSGEYSKYYTMVNQDKPKIYLSS